MDGELLSLKWNNHRTTFYHIISSLRNKESYTDVTLACDGKFYPAHKFVLSTCSEYFSEIFVRTPCKNPVVVLKDIQCRDLEFLLDYMYIGEVNVRQNELTSLIKAAECLRVKGLAVPDEEPKTSSSNSSARQRPEHSSPPAKRRRAEERRSTSVVNDQSPGRPPGDVPLGSPDQRETRVSNVGGSVSGDVQDNNSEIVDTIVIKEEKDTQDEISLNVQNSYEEGDDKGDVPQDSEGNSTGDFPDFLSSTIEKEEPEFTSDFAGPSGLQNSNVTPWESENSATSFPEGISGSVAAAVAAVSQPQQRQQQQLWQQHPGRSGSNTNTSSSNSSSSSSISYVAGGLSVPCPVCGKVISRRDNLRVHMRVHTGESPYPCPICPHRSKTGGNLRKHMRSIHGADPADANTVGNVPSGTTFH